MEGYPPSGHPQKVLTGRAAKTFCGGTPCWNPLPNIQKNKTKEKRRDPLGPQTATSTTKWPKIGLTMANIGLTPPQKVEMGEKDKIWLAKDAK